MNVPHIFGNIQAATSFNDLYFEGSLYMSFLKIYFLERVPDERTDCQFGDISVHTP